MRMLNKKKKFTALFALMFFLTTACAVMPTVAAKEKTYQESARDAMSVGGGYAATGQIYNTGYTSQIYNAANGLPTSDANYILGASDGYIWIGGYSGILRYDGSSFTRLDTSGGLTNGRGLFEDSKGRIWVGTNDNGVVVIDGNESTHITYREGLPSSSIRAFAEDRKGRVYIGTTAGVCYADVEMSIHIVDDERLDNEKVMRLDSDPSGRIYGQTQSGLIFRIEDTAVSGVYSGNDLGIDKITTLITDPLHDGNLYIGTESGYVLYGGFGARADVLKWISVSPLKGIHWISYDCGRVWIASTSAAGYLDEDNRFHLLENIAINSGIEMMTSDYQGNMWFASSTQGVMKIVTDHFVDLFQAAGLSAEVTNAVCIHGNELYVGTDNGLRILDKNKNVINNELTRFMEGARVRCIKEGAYGELWIGAYTNELGLVCLSEDGSITSFTKKNGMPDDEVRCICVRDDGSVLAGTNGGLAVIKNGKVVKTVGAEDGIRNTTLLSVEEGDNGSIYVGTDGDGLYVIDEDEIRRIGRDEGLTSDVIMRIKKDDDSGICWIVTSNSIEYIKNGVIVPVKSFPYNNNYDLYFNSIGDALVVSSCGVFSVNTDDMLKDKVTKYRLYTAENGLLNTPTSFAYCAFGEDGYLYIPGRNGVCRMNIERFSQENIPVKAAISSICLRDKQIIPDEDGNYILPAEDGRITVTVSVMDYTLSNPTVKVFMEGKEKDSISTERSKLQPLEFTGLEYGDYSLHIKVLDSSGENEFLDKKFRIVKKPRLLEMPAIRLLLFLAAAAAAGAVVWRRINSTVVKRQRDELRQAKEEAKRADTAKFRFLANISNELRMPINTIMGMNEMAMREDATGVPKAYFMSMMNYAFDIRNASETLLSLIKDLLDMSRIASGEMKLEENEYETVEMIRSVIPAAKARSAEKELDFDVEVDEMLPSRMFGDCGKIRQIVLNLLSNAVKYTDAGRVIFSVSIEEREDEECRLRFSVKDTGRGIKQENIEKLFTAYEHLDERNSGIIIGTGLGLDISRRFAGILGGKLTCESVYGKGSEFILTVNQKIADKTPIGVFTEQEDSSLKGRYAPQFIAPGADVLVVSGDPMIVTVIKGLLKATEVFVSTAASGEECLEIINDTGFDIVFIDNTLPGMDGIKVVSEIRADHPRLPVYALSANTGASDEYFRSKGFTGYLSKPVSGITLEKVIMEHLPEEMMEKPEPGDSSEDIKELPPEMLWLN